MEPQEEYYRAQLAHAKKKHEDSLEALARVHYLLAKADEQYKADPGGSRKWLQVLDNLEDSLDESKSWVNVAEVEVLRYERKLTEVLARIEEKTEAGDISLEDAEEDGGREPEGPRPKPMNLEEASKLRADIDSGKVSDKRVAANLELSNQAGETYAADESGEIPRRQMALRSAIDKISQGRFDRMTYDEVKLVLACRKLLCRRLEPNSRDVRLKRIIDGASQVLKKRKAEFEAAEAKYKDDPPL